MNIMDNFSLFGDLANDNNLNNNNASDEEEEDTVVDTTMQQKYVYAYTVDMMVESNLMQLMIDIGAPLYAYQKVYKWAKDAYKLGYKFDAKATTYDSQIKQMQSQSYLKRIWPVMETVSLPGDNQLVDICEFDFTTMLAALLDDKEVNQDCNLVVNKDDHFAWYESPNGKLGEVNSGHWYQQAYDNKVMDPNKDFLMPIILAMDKTTISNSAHLHVFAVMFTTTIFDLKTCNKAHAWRLLGYIPIDRNHYSTEQWKNISTELKCQCQNVLFQKVLKSYRTAQCDGALQNVEVTLGSQTKCVNLKVPLAFIIGDIQGGDGICGRPAYYGDSAKRICRMCNATKAAYDSKQMDCCELLVMDDIKQMCINKEYDKLDALYQYRTWQAFYDIDYGGSPCGVLTAACPPEALHSLENGLINHCLKELFDRVIPKPAQCKLDKVVQKWSLLPKQHLMKSYAAECPRLLFADGVSAITDTSAATKVGKLFAIVVAALTRDGRDVMLNDANIIKKCKDKEERNLLYNEMIVTFEMLLCYWAWLKKKEYWDCSDMDALQIAKMSIFKTIDNLKKLFPRSTGNAWNIPKIKKNPF